VLEVAGSAPVSQIFRAIVSGLVVNVRNPALDPLAFEKREIRKVKARIGCRLEDQAAVFWRAEVDKDRRRRPPVLPVRIPPFTTWQNPDFGAVRDSAPFATVAGALDDPRARFELPLSPIKTPVLSSDRHGF
jgi:hypothetical protein